MNLRVATVDTPGRTEAYEADLVDRATARSAAAWTEIYTTHYGAIFRYVKARVFDAPTAEDLAAAVFVGALKNIDSYRYRGQPLLAWLYRIARNVVASHQRELLARQGGPGLGQRLVSRFIRRGAPGSADAGLDSAVAPARESDPAMMIESLDLRDAIARLPGSQREVVILRFFVGLSAQETAAVIGKGTAAIYSLQARAIFTLRGKLRQDFEKDASGSDEFPRDQR